MQLLEKSTERIEALEALLRRLCSQDLTLSESKRLRDALSDLLGLDDKGVRHERGLKICAHCVG